VTAAVDLEQHALPGVAVPPLPVPCRSPTARRGHPAVARIRCTVGRERTMPWCSASISVRC
jgi:hypothetical protein